MIIASAFCGSGFNAYGDSVLKVEHMRYRMDAPELTGGRGIIFELSRGITEVEDGFFLQLPTIEELLVDNSECNVNLNDETVQLFHKNNVLIRGPFDGAAEKLAGKYGFRFLHTDQELAAGGDFYTKYGCDQLALCFRKDGSAYIRRRNNSESFGGELTFDLQDNFYETMDADSIAKEYGGQKYAEEIGKNEAFRTMMEKAVAKGGFFHDFREKR